MPVLPEGRYRAESPEGFPPSLSRKGLPQMVVKATLTHRHIGEQDIAIEDTERRMYWSLVEKYRDFTREKLEALGFDGKMTNPGFSVKEFYVDVKHGQGDDGSIFERVDIARDGSGEPLTAEDINALAVWWETRATAKAAAPPEPDPTDGLKF